MQIADVFAEEWQEWKKEAGIILGRTKQSFLEGAFSLLIMAVYGSCSAAYAAEFGGFEVSTGTGEYEGNGEEWEDEPVCNTPEQNDSNTYVDEARNDGQESEQNTSGTVSSYNEEYEQVPVQNWNARESSTTTEKTVLL